MESVLLDEELNEAEQKLRWMYLRNPSRYADRPCDEGEVRNILTIAFPKGLTGTDDGEGRRVSHLETMIQEQAFIPQDMDITFVRHLRYMPAFWHRHTFFELLCVLKGSCLNIFHDRELPMTEGDICIHAPGTVHAVSAFSDDAVLINILLRKSTFEQAFFSMMQGNSILSGFFKRSFYRTREMPYLLFHAQGDEALSHLILEAKAEAETDHRYKRHMVNVLISQLFIRMLENHEHSIELPELHLNGKHTDLMEILDYINRNYTTITLKQLSQRFNYSERQMQRIITDATGMPFSKSIQNQKMQRAASLLTGSDLSVSAICEQVGYPSQNNFRKVFLRYYGVTPSAYRSGHQADFVAVP